MSLFAIQRFESGSTSDLRPRENTILQELHKRAASKAQEKEKNEKRKSEQNESLSESFSKRLKQQSVAEDTTQTAGKTSKALKQELSVDNSSKDICDKLHTENSKDYLDNKSHNKKDDVSRNKRKKKTSLDEIHDEIANSDSDEIETNSDRIEDIFENDKSDLMDVSIEESEQSSVNEKYISKSKDGQTHEVIGGFTVIGEVTKKWKERVHRVLPEWLAHPSVVEADIRAHQTPLSHISQLDDDIREKLRENNITSFFPVQTQVIPALLDGVKTGFLSGPMGYRPSDICCSAPTGSGKTLAFVIPIVQALKHRVTVQVRALVVLPTRDLANQVYKVFETFTSGTGLKVGMAHGQKSFKFEQDNLVRNGPRGCLSLVDVVIATPGRLVDHINQTAGFSLTHLRFLVIDEADRVMQEIQQDWLGAVERAVNIKHAPLTVAHSRHETCCQKLLFSATLSQNPEKLQQLNLFQPKLFTSTNQQPGNNQTVESAEKVKHAQGDFVGKYTTPSGLSEYYIPCTPAQKPLILLYYILHLRYKQVLCFTNSINSAHRLYWVMKLIGVNVREMTSNLSAQQRTRYLKQFASGELQLLVCSDAMARGMDVENVKYVISYETTRAVDTYVHRVGRTARAGKVGTAITLLEKKEVHHFKQLLKQAGKTGVKERKVASNDIRPYLSSVTDSLQQLPDILKQEKLKK